MPAFAGMTLPRNLGEIRHGERGGADLGEQREAVGAQRGGIGPSATLTVTLSKNASTGARSSASARMAPAKFSTLMAAARVLLHLLDGRVQRPLLRLAQQREHRRRRRSSSCPSSPRRGGCWSRACTPASRLAPSSVLQELAQRLDPLDDQRQVVLPAQREHRIDQVVPRPLLAQVHLEPVGEEGEEVCVRALRIHSLSSCVASHGLARSRSVLRPPMPGSRRKLAAVYPAMRCDGR